MSVEAVILDWAGTTVDYGCFAPVQAFVDAFAEKEIDVTLEEVRKPMGMLKRDHIITMLNMPRIQTIFEIKNRRKYTSTDVDELYKIFTEHLMKKLGEGTELKPHVLKVFGELKKSGIKIGSTTGYTTAMLLPVAECAAKLGYKPDSIFTPDDVNGLGRPHPDMILSNLKALGVETPANVIKVGDTVSDIEEAIAAGVRAFGVIEGSSVIGLSEQEWNALSEEQKEMARQSAKAVFLEAGAENVLTDLHELIDYL